MARAGRDVVLEPDALLAAAVEQAGGLTDFGPMDFVERLDVLCRAMREEGGFGDGGIFAQQQLLIGLLKNRLLIEDLVRRHPEILDEPVIAPIIICGLPRTGTTHLHNLLAADPALRAIPYWESREPVLDPTEAAAVAAGAPDPRLARTEQALWLVNAAMPHFVRMHEMTVDHAHEEIQLLAIDFSTMLFETSAPMPTWRDYYHAHDQTSSYRYLRKVLQVLQWLRPGAGGRTRWVLKSPQHIEQFPVLLRVFPDATFLVTHRDPVTVTTSMATMLAYSARTGRDRVDVHGIGHYWADRLERMLRSCVADRDLLPPDQTLDVRFHEFMADDLAMLRRVYEVAGQPFDEPAQAAVTRFLREHPRGRHGSVRYRPEQVGLDRAERRKALAFYSDRFGVPAET
ncbi:MAG: sulfotransferase [Frankia sp.]|nr:sulfotransferase [Frankia sp.]